MKMILRSILLLLSIALVTACKDKKKEVETQMAEVEATVPTVRFVKDLEHKKIAVFLNGTLFTNYIYDGSTPKPVLYPLITRSGKTLTRGFPFEPRPGERVDHPHHVGLWFNYGNVNGLDFWNNSFAIPEDKKDAYGTIVPEQIVSLDSVNGILTTKSLWQSPDGVDLIEETTRFYFSEIGNTRQIDRVATLKALEDVEFKDNKEGMLGVRVARQLEMPSDKPDIFTDANGIATEVKALDNSGVTGNYLTSEGKTGDDAWGTRAKWTTLYGTMNKEPVSITILDNPQNIGYPTYWHARGYGLFAANPLGQAVFSDGKETLDYKLKKGNSVTFKYRILIHNGTELAKEQLDSTFVNFSKEE
ncbi:PmoA family protein [Flavobacteriaceae bacterium F89]|uniref:PmoA family protein n=1 Tax=Cerina litoralis TaxID=2874477 RepID=A0AAE3JQC9_9FLAO|nr:PmoA family protein [Cerina litoralis]MCG2461729.1 PmoA family protein [Cerina litoralis]